MATYENCDWCGGTGETFDGSEFTGGRCSGCRGEGLVKVTTMARKMSEPQRILLEHLADAECLLDNFFKCYLGYRAVISAVLRSGNLGANGCVVNYCPFCGVSIAHHMEVKAEGQEVANE